MCPSGTEATTTADDAAARQRPPGPGPKPCSGACCDYCTHSSTSADPGDTIGERQYNRSDFTHHSDCATSHSHRGIECNACSHEGGHNGCAHTPAVSSKHGEDSPSWHPYWYRWRRDSLGHSTAGIPKWPSAESLHSCLLSARPGAVPFSSSSNAHHVTESVESGRHGDCIHRSAAVQHHIPKYQWLHDCHHDHQYSIQKHHSQQQRGTESRPHIRLFLLEFHELTGPVLCDSQVTPADLTPPKSCHSSHEGRKRQGQVCARHGSYERRPVVLETLVDPVDPILDHVKPS